MKKSNLQMSETFRLGALLAVCGGFLDAYTYLCRGHVFANAQTGNVVLLGLNLAQGQVAEALGYVIPIVAFALGIVLAELLRGAFCKRRLHWRQAVILVEVGILLFVAFLPQGRWDTTANVLVAFVCAMQVQTFRKMQGSVYATTMCTGNLRSGTELLVDYFKTGDKSLLKKGLAFYGIILFFIVGAALGAFFAVVLGIWAVLVAAGLLLCALGMMFF